MQRREFLKNSTIATTAAVVGIDRAALAAKPVARPLIKKSLKYGMVTEKISVLDKFKLLKDLGFDGVELDSPNDLDPKEILEARDKTGLLIPGVVNSVHWKSPLSDADPKVRETCSKSMIKSLNDCKLYGGTTVLLVPGVVNAGTSYQDAYQRAQKEIIKLIPEAEKTGIKIALENVWNNFLISPVEAARFVDEINHPLVGWYFDVGNILRYGWPEHWIETLGKRIMKIDIKEFSRKKQQDEGLWKGFDVELMDGDCNWPVVNNALAKVGYSGWGSAEVPGGDRKRLQVISERMDAVFNAQ
ncbi:sugar phosphate isomerase/epimerase [Runella sp. SP2]|uniref:sugar phosphate isomerase/epimerase family protein n=1 Tax=Runella sp. SP2 TaxID=2268026 RepID=UPI000F07A0DB|nr:sugar phosphate isomerase/epimerase family protein [Runella sp. SP2]AYQ31312.1 sugar phosphate isomerase/epimerase [Runella sp. SP2]